MKQNCACTHSTVNTKCMHNNAMSSAWLLTINMRPHTFQVESSQSEWATQEETVINADFIFGTQSAHDTPCQRQLQHLCTRQWMSPLKDVRKQSKCHLNTPLHEVRNKNEIFQVNYLSSYQTAYWKLRGYNCILTQWITATGQIRYPDKVRLAATACTLCPHISTLEILKMTAVHLFGFLFRFFLN